jgi:antitoxin component of MazEF toxin-antitoxin module
MPIEPEPRRYVLTGSRGEDQPTYTLEELLAGITEENLHGETFRTAPVGNEVV